MHRRMAAGRMHSIERRHEAVPALPSEPSVGAALERVIDLSQEVVVDRIELLQVESQARLLAFARRAAGLGIATFVLLLAWVLLAAAVVAALANRLPLEGALAIVAAVHAAVGGAALAWASRALEGDR